MSFGPGPRLQPHWDARAAANFVLGGSGAGLAAAAAVSDAHPRLALGLAALLVAAGLLAVWLETGRRLRAVHVLFNPRTSWMSREAWAALALLAFAAAAFATGESRVLPPLAAAAALAFLYCQARILTAAKGIPAWREPAAAPLIVATGLAEGSAAALVLAPDSRLALALAAGLVLARALLLARYLRRVEGRLAPGARAALEPAAAFLRQVGTVLPLALFAVAALEPALGAAAAVVAGLAAVAGGWRFKATLVTRAAFNQGFSLKEVPIR